MYICIYFFGWRSTSCSHGGEKGVGLWTGRKPTLRTYEMICYYLMDWASDEELLAHLEKLTKLP
jgi:hypothetical protein